MHTAKPETNKTITLEDDVLDFLHVHSKELERLVVDHSHDELKQAFQCSLGATLADLRQLVHRGKNMPEIFALLEFSKY